MSNLLDKASIILTPTAYNNGEALCVKPSDGSGDFDFSRNSAATRVNAQGLVENVQILSSNLVQNGDFSEEGAEEVSNGSFSQEGVQLVTNGSFDTDSNWNKQTSNWTISNGYAICDGLQTTNSSLFQDLAVVNGNSYRIDFTITDSANDLNLILGATTIGQYGSGTHSIYVTKDANASARIFFQATASNGFQGSIDNVSCVEVGQDWTLGTGWSIGEDKAISDTTASNLTPSTVLVSGKTYKFTLDVAKISVGSFTFLLRFNGSNTVIGTINSEGSFTFYAKADATGFRLQNLSGGTTDFSITNISVKEVGQNWNLGTGVIIANSKLTKNDPSVGNTSASQGAVFTVGKTYKYKLVVSGNLTASDKVVGFFTDFTSAGTYEGYFTANTTSLVFSLRGSTNIYSIDSVSVIEITDDTNLPRINYEGFSYQDALGSEEIVNGGFDTNLNNWVAYSNTLISWESGGYALLNSNNNYWCKIKQSNVFEIGKTYKVILTAKSNRTDLNFHNSPITGSFSQADTFETFDQYYTATSTDFLFGYANAGSSTITIDNVSVKEYLGQEVVPDSGCGSWLWEPQSTNTILISNSVSTMNYSSNITKIDNAAISPDSTFNSMIFTPTATSGIHRAGYSTTAGLYTQNDVVTFSGFVKANGYDFITMGGFFGQEKAVFNVSNGTLVSQESNVINTEIVKLTNDWYRVSTTYTFQNSIGNGYLYAGIYVMDTETGYAFTGDGVSGVYGYGFQAELGTGTSYIPTEGSTVTRNQDVCTNGGSLATINSTEGVLYAEIAINQNDNGGFRLISMTDASDSVRVGFGKKDNQAKWYIKILIGALNITSQAIDFQEGFQKIAIRYKSGDSGVYINGTKVITDTSNYVNTLIIDNVSFDFTGNAFPFYGKTKALAVWKEALSDQELTELTTI